MKTSFKAALSSDKSYSKFTLGSGWSLLDLNMLMTQTWLYEPKLYIHSYASK